MKVLGVKNEKYFIASAGHHDYIEIDDLMVDGGQPGCTGYAGYTRHCGERCWAEIPITFAEFYTDYQLSLNKERQYGIWMFKPLSGKCQVRILNKDEIPDTESFVWRVENALWGTRGKDGKQPFKYIHLLNADKEHLQNISDFNFLSEETREIVDFLLKK